MKLIFIKDLPGVAKRDEVREVKEGFAINFLLPQKVALRATKALIESAKARAAAAVNSGVATRAKAEGWVAQLKGKTVTLSARASENGTLYAGVGPEAVASAIAAELHVPVEPGNVVLPAHLKALGSHSITITIAGVSCAMSVNINQA